MVLPWIVVGHPVTGKDSSSLWRNSTHFCKVLWVCGEMDIITRFDRVVPGSSPGGPTNLKRKLQ